MEYKTKEQSHVQTLLSELPIAKHFGGNLQSSIENAQKDKGKAIALILKLAFMGALGYLAWTYILPPVFQMLGKFAAVAATALAAVGLAFALPGIFRWFGIMGKNIKKAAINSDPFIEFDRQEKLMLKNQQEARASHMQIQKLEEDMHLEARANEKKAGDYQTKIISNKAKADALNATIKNLEKEHGPVRAKEMDEWVQANASLIKVLSDSQRLSAQLEQAQNFVRKYGARAATMKKVGHKLTLMEVVMDNKVLDFRATVEILKADYEFARKSRTATDAAKKAMLFDKSWELEYALDVVATTVANDIAQTAGNFKDINMLTANFDFDNDEMYANLEKLTAQIQSGENVTPNAKAYNRPDYNLTQEDKLQSGGFGSMF